MSERKIQVFLYGSAINLDVLVDAGLPKRAFAAGMLIGFDLVIQPVANLVENGDGIVYGILANFTHEELGKLTSYHTKNLTEATYNPEPVLIRTRGGKIVPALTYLSVNLKPSFADDTYIDRILTPAQKYGFPTWYQDRIEAFRSKA